MGPAPACLFVGAVVVAGAVACTGAVAPTTPVGVGPISSFVLPSPGAQVLPSRVSGAVTSFTAPSAGAPPVQPTVAVPGAPGVPVEPGAGPTLPISGIPGQPGGAPVAGPAQAPPAWVKPGARVTFYAAAASVAQSRFAYVEDPNGNLEDPRTGKKYRRTDTDNEPMGSASGDGVTQVDVLAVEGTEVVISSSLYGIDHGNNLYTLIPGTGAKVPGASVEGVWVHPQALASLMTRDLGGLLVLRGPYPVGTTTYDTLSFVNTNPSAYASYTYDLEPACSSRPPPVPQARSRRSRSRASHRPSATPS